MPLVVVNIFPIVTRVVIQFLSTLEVTVRRHFCSILKHKSSGTVEAAESAEVRFTARDGHALRTAHPTARVLKLASLSRSLAHERLHQSLVFLPVKLTTTT
jgi:hypothetical protein